MQKAIFSGIVFSGIIFVLSQCQLGESRRTEAAYEHYCGACHLTPDPNDLPKALWTKQVLPEMGARLGIQVGDYDPMKGLNMEETFYVKQAKTYPETPLISEEHWTKIYDYIVERAPDSLLVGNQNRNERSQKLMQFQPRPLTIDSLPGSYITALRYDSIQHYWWIGSRKGAWYRMKDTIVTLIHSFGSAVSNFERFGDKNLILEMGYMDPSDIPTGRLWQFEGEERQLIADRLQRPVFVSGLNMEQDGQIEYLICEYGYRTGRLSLWQKEGNSYQSKNLLNLPGTIRVQRADMNKDGRDDLVILAAQGDEGIYIYYNQGDGNFSVEKSIRLPSVYGSSWFELLDYEGDGDLDIALVNGDNADFTYTLKPYHGLRLFLNDGNNDFSEAFFYPIFGATRVITRDFDLDGDFDFAVTSLFPDFINNPKESFIYLENQESTNFVFQSYTTPAALKGHWLVMEAGDFEGDGDLDILLGSYIASPAAPSDIRQEWEKQNVDLLLLQNIASISK